MQKMKKNKLLICALFMSLILTVLPGMESYAAGETGESAATSELQDENSQRLDSVTAMDEEGGVYEVGESDGTLDESLREENETEADEIKESGDEIDGGIDLFSVESERAVSTKVVNFNTKGNATTDFKYGGGSGYTNGNYGADAAYLGTDSSGKIRFMLAGVTGTVDKSEVELADYSSVEDNVSYYSVSDGKLIHYISYNLNNKPTSSINNGPAPSYLSSGTKYYSYDGHFFYKSYEVMISDYQSGKNGSNAVNSGNAFYNYFQFLDMNSSTNYTGDELNEMLSSKISSSRSKLLGTGALFVKYQDKYSVNALLSLGIAVNESAWGTSSICVNKNNLFGLNAVDKLPGESANYFASVEDCIREFMSEWMADGYLSSSDWRNHGEYLGNKAAGINVSYASDPYWGEKAAAIAWELDAAGGSYDYLGINSGSADNDIANEEGSSDTGQGSSDEGSSDAGQNSSDDEQSSSDGEHIDNKKPSGTENTDSVGNPSKTDETPEISQPTSDDKGKQEETQPSNSQNKDSVSTLVNTEHGITVRGIKNGSMKVQAIEPDTATYISCVSSAPVKGKEILGVYNIVVSGAIDGKVQLTFRVGSEYSGRNVIILHYNEDGSYDTYRGTVENGQVTISVEGFSPYVIALDDDTSAGTGNRAPQTGDTQNPGFWAAMMGISAVLCMMAVLKRKNCL